MRQLKIATQITNRDSQAVEKYLQEISKIPMISPEEETTLAQRIKMGDQRALDKLVQSNLRLQPMTQMVALLYVRLLLLKRLSFTKLVLRNHQTCQLAHKFV